MIRVSYKTSTGLPMPLVPQTIAEMIPARQAEIAARKAPACDRENHGRMRPVPLEVQTYERMYCGVSYECDKPDPAGRAGHCQGNSMWYSRELSAYHGMPYVVDEAHWETWDGEKWQPMPQAEFDAYWAKVRADEERAEVARRATARRQRSAAHRHARGAAATSTKGA